MRYSGFIIALAICLLLLCSFVFKYTYNTILTIFIFLYMLFLFFGRSVSKYFFASFYFIFISFYLLYTNMFPFLFFWGGINFFNIQERYLVYAYICAARFYLCMLIPFFLAPNAFIIEFHPQRCSLFKESICQLPRIPLLVFSFLLLCEHIISFVFFGGLDFYLSGSTSRTDINIYAKGSLLGGLGGYLNVLLVIVVLVKKLNAPTKIILLLPVIFNCATSIFMGGRKEILFIIMILFLFSAMKIIYVKKRVLIFLFSVMFVAIFYRSVIMDAGWRGNVFQRIAGIGGEFIFPQITFPMSLQYDFSADEFNYPTLLDGFLYFIPRTIFPLKNYSISTVFSGIVNINMGFATTPLLEAYINFGNYGYFFEAIILTVMLRLFTIICNKKNNLILYTFAFIYLIDLNRGEISFYIRQMIESTIIIFIVLLFLNEKNAYYFSHIKLVN